MITANNNSVAQSAHNATNSRCRDDSEQWEAIHSYVVIISSSALILLGTAGNIATYSVFKQRVYRHNIMARMFRYLSLLDMIFLWTIVSQFWIKGVSGHSLFSSTTNLCLFVMFSSQSLMSLTNWMLVVITLARLIHLKCPFKAPDICTKLNYNLLLVGTHILVIGTHGGVMLSMKSRLSAEDYSSGKTCYYQLSRKEIQTTVHTMLNMSINFLGPAIMLIFYNTILIIELRALQKRRNILFGQAPISNKYMNMYHGGTFAESTQNQTQNALGREETLQVPQQASVRTTENKEGYDRSMHETLYVKLAMQKYHTLGFNEASPSSQTSGEPAGQQRWRCLVEHKTTRKDGHNLSKRWGMIQHPTTAANSAKGRELNGSSPARRNSLRILEETDTAQNAEVPNTTTTVTTDSILRNFNWNNPEPQQLAVASLRVSDATNPTSKNNKDTLKVEHSRRYLGASLTTVVDSETTSQSQTSHGQAASNIKRFSVRTWLSEAWSHGVDMEVDADTDSDVVQASVDHIKEEGAHQKPESADSRWNSRTQSLTQMLIGASFVFILLNTPFWVLHLGAIEYFTNNPSVGCNLRLLVVDVVLLLRYSNNSINFLFYCALGSRFRHDFVTWFRKLFR